MNDHSMNLPSQGQNHYQAESLCPQVASLTPAMAWVQSHLHCISGLRCWSANHQVVAVVV